MLARDNEVVYHVYVYVKLVELLPYIHNIANLALSWCDLEYFDKSTDLALTLSCLKKLTENL